jgi:molecular chaperone GrpE
MSDQQESPAEALPPQQEEAIDYKDKYLRLLAEGENARKRMQKEKLEAMRFGIENLFSEFLGPIDNFETALKAAEHASSDVKMWASGFTMILHQLKEVLGQHGIAPFESKDQPFDPRQHEAVETEENRDLPDGIVAEEYVKGYRCGDRIIRPARVKVNKLSRGEPTV